MKFHMSNDNCMSRMIERTDVIIEYMIRSILKICSKI